MAKEHRDDVSAPEDERSEAERKREEYELDPENERAVETAKNIATDYVHSNRVEGYGRSDDGYGGPYHPDAFFDPQVKFALAGAPEAQAKFTEELIELDKAKAKEEGRGIDKVDLVAASAHSTVVEEHPYRAAAETIEVEATHDNVAEAAARKHYIGPRSDEDPEGAVKRVFENDSAAKPAKDANDAPEKGDGDPPSRNTAGTQEEDANSPDDGDHNSREQAKSGDHSDSDTAKKSTEAAKKSEPAKKTTAKKAPAKKTATRKFN